MRVIITIIIIIIIIIVMIMVNECMICMMMRIYVANGLPHLVPSDGLEQGQQQTCKKGRDLIAALLVSVDKGKGKERERER